VDWTPFETAWHDTACRILSDVAAANPGEILYAAAFHLFYADGAQILAPALAANVESAVHANDGYPTRFVPPEWRWDVLDAASKAMAPWYEHLSAGYAAAGSVEGASAAIEEAHDAAIARVCRAVTATARGGGVHDSLPPGFVVVILDGARGDEEAGLIRASVDPRVLPTVPELAGHLRELDEA
jgi:hypothetical protein